MTGLTWPDELTATALITEEVETPTGLLYTVPVVAVGSGGTVAPVPTVKRMVAPGAALIVTVCAAAYVPERGLTCGAAGAGGAVGATWTMPVLADSLPTRSTAEIE